MVRNYIVAVLFVGVLAAPEARAQAGGGQGWSVLAGQTVGAGRRAAWQSWMCSIKLGK
ncbi:MAG: hypothetical protein L0Y64_07135 [Myxococcaceae bacterium]|nr:hypothetical protein [Myxococcaceae bacterium]